MGTRLKDELESRFLEVFQNIENSSNTADQKAELMAVQRAVCQIHRL